MDKKADKQLNVVIIKIILEGKITVSQICEGHFKTGSRFFA
jgi:hypothetical protein